MNLALWESDHISVSGMGLRQKKKKKVKKRDK